MMWTESSSGQSMQLMEQIAEQTLDVNKLKGQTVRDVLATLSKRAVAEDRPLVEKAQQALAQIPIINDLPFEEVYLRASLVNK